jgi:hypothetical protein
MITLTVISLSEFHCRLFNIQIFRRLDCFEVNKLFSLRKRSNFFFLRSEFAKVKNFETPSTEFWREETHRWSSEQQLGATKKQFNKFQFKTINIFLQVCQFKMLNQFTMLIMLFLLNDQQGRTNTRGNDRRSK